MKGDGRTTAAWVLVLLAPLCAEATFSGISLPTLWLGLPLLVPMYGAGVLVVRELAVRAGAGWPGLVLLGVAYELLEDGIALQALTSTRIYTAADWGPRVLGLNTTYWESQIGYHVVFTVLIPIALADLLFPRHAGRPYLGRGGLVGACVAAAAGFAIVRFLVAGFEDPGYQAPLPVVVGVTAAVVVLGVLALVVEPRLRRARPRPRPGTAPPWVVAAIAAGAGAFGFLALLFPAGHAAGHPATGGFVVGAMVLAALIAAAATALVPGWVRAADAAGHGRAFRIRLIGGAMVGHSLYGVVGALADGAVVHAVVAGTIVIAMTVLALAWLERREPEAVRRDTVRSAG